MFRFEQLDIWQDARSYIGEIYSLTARWPRSELFGLTSQIRRSAVSVAANIAEGSASSSRKDFRNYLDHSRKSLFETVSHLYIALDQKYITKKQFGELYSGSEKMIRRISAFQKSLL